VIESPFAAVRSGADGSIEVSDGAFRAPLVRQMLWKLKKKWLQVSAPEEYRW
jgi:hypothetical protein